MLACPSLPLADSELYERLLAEFTEELAQIFPSRCRLQQRADLGELENDLIAWGKFFLPHHFKQPPSKMHREIAALLDGASRERRTQASRERQQPEELHRQGSGIGGWGSGNSSEDPHTLSLTTNHQSLTPEFTSSSSASHSPFPTPHFPLKLNLLAPRASAKSTLVTLAYVLRAALSGLQPYIWIISDTERQAMAHLENLYAKLKDNALLQSFYRRALPLVRTGNRITLNGVAIEAYGAGQRLRGHRWHEHRPTLIICDDLQNDGHIRSPAQRDRSRTWFHSMLMKAGTKRTRIINLGTALHREALSLELHTTPGWTSLRYQAIEHWPTNMQLWAEWEGMYRGETSALDPEGIAAISPGSRSAPGVDERTNPSDPGRGRSAPEPDLTRWHPSRMQTNLECPDDRGCRSAQSPANGCDPSGINLTSSHPHIFASSSAPQPQNALPQITRSSPQQLARQFFTAHRDEMEAGNALLWPEEEDLYTLMCMRAESGPAAFEREKQCIPLNPEECEWPETYFADEIWFDHWPQDLRLKTIALDPSKGADAKHGDYSAFVMLGVANDGKLYVEANLARRPTPQIVTDGVELIKSFRPQAFGVETNQFQSLLAADFAAEFQRQRLIGVRPYTLDNQLAKTVRIRRLGPLLAARLLRFKSNSPGTKLLVEHLREFPLAKHDDGPDALEMALRLAENLLQPIPNDGLGSRLLAIFP